MSKNKERDAAILKDILNGEKVECISLFYDITCTRVRAIMVNQLRKILTDEECDKIAKEHGEKALSRVKWVRENKEFFINIINSSSEFKHRAAILV